MSGISISNPFKDLDQPVVIRPSNSPGPQGPAAPEVKIQYSIDTMSWHDTPAENDMYIRFSTNNGRSWGEPLLISNLAGSVIGPESSVDGNIAVFDGATGKAIKDSGEMLSDVLSDISTLQDDVSTLQDDVSTLQDDVSQSNNRPWDVIIEDQKPSGTNGGRFDSGAWRTRDLNTLVYNHDSLASLSNNRFTLPAGTYCIDWDAPGQRVDRHKSRLYNYTNSSTVAYGTNAYATAAVHEHGSSSRSWGTVIVTITGSTTFEIQHRAEAPHPGGFGEITNFGIEIYTRVRIKKIA